MVGLPHAMQTYAAHGRSTRDSVPCGGWGDPVPFLASWHTAAAPGCRADVAHWACVYSRKDWRQGSGDGLGPSMGKDRACLVTHVISAIPCVCVD